MVKIPGLDDLKKMGTGLIDSAKSVKFGEMVEKFTSKGSGPIPQGDEAVKAIFQNIHSSISELIEMQNNQTTTIKKLQSQIADLGRIVEASQKPQSPSEPPPPEENITS